jgi:hypothetical protein
MQRFLVLALLLTPAVALADEDAIAPPLALDIDPARPMYRYATYIDPVALFQDGYGFSVMASLGRFASVTISPFGKGGDDGTLGLELGLHARPLGRALHGPFVGGGVGALLLRGEGDDEEAFRVFADAGYGHVLGGMLLGASLGATVTFTDGTRDVAPRIRVMLGFAFR